LFAQQKGDNIINALGLRTYGSLGLTLLVDSHMRIRWRACGPLVEDDVASLRAVIPNLIHEYRLEQYSQDLMKIQNEKKKPFSSSVGYTKKK
jgi:hypothetical protein